MSLSYWIGIAWVIFLVILLFLPKEGMIFAVLFSCLFPSIAVFFIGDTGINPCIIAEAFLLIKTLMLRQTWAFDKTTLWIIRFVIWGIIITLISPILFTSIQNKFGFNSLLDYQIDFSLDFSAIAKIFLVLMHVIGVLCFYQLREYIDIDKTFKLVFILCTIELFLGIWQYIYVKYGILFFPEEIFFGNTHYAIWNQRRMRGTFQEASMFSGIVAPLFVGSMCIESRNCFFLKTICIICLILSQSTTGLFSAAAGIGIFFIFNYKSKSSWKNIVVFGIIGVVALFILGQNEIFKVYFMDKIIAYFNGGRDYVSATALERSTWDKVAIEVFFSTYGLGGGLNCARANSFFATMLATIGVFGTFFFAMFIYHLLQDYYLSVRINEKAGFIFFALITNILTKLVALPDYNDMAMWIFIFLAVVYGKKAGITHLQEEAI